MPKAKTDAKMLRGLSLHLRHFLAANAEALLTKGRALGPTSPPQVAKWLTDHGQYAGDRTLGPWVNGKVLPASAYVTLLEELLGMTWRDIVNPAAKLPTEDEARAVRAWLRLSPAERVVGLARLAASPAARR